MAKKRERIQNPQPFLSEENDSSFSKRRSKSRDGRKQHLDQEEKLISSGTSSKIIKEAMIQQREVEDEEIKSLNPDNSLLTVSETELTTADQDDYIDNFAGFDDTQTRYPDYGTIDEDEERILDSFLSKDATPQRTLADVIIAKLKNNDVGVSSEARPLPKMDTGVIDLYKEIGKLLSRYTAGKMPKGFKHIPSMPYWEDVLYLTEPEKWSPNAMYQATRIFASNLGVKMAERFYKLVLLPRVREDIRKNKRLHFSLYQSLKKSIYKPGAFFKGVLFPLCESKTCNLREAVIIGSILEKLSIPLLHSSVALFKLSEMEYCGTTSYFIKILLEKKYALPYRVLDALVAHFMRFMGDERIMPVIWHQSLLAFVQRYKHELHKEDKENLRMLLEKQKHKLVTPEISWELNNSRNRGEKEDDLMSIASPMSVINKPIEEDRFDIPDVPMEED